MKAITSPDITDPPRSKDVSGRMLRIQLAINEGAGTPFTLQALPEGKLKLRDVNDRLYRLAEQVDVDLHGLTEVTSWQINDRLRRIEAGLQKLGELPAGGGSAIGLPRYGAAVYGVSRYGGVV